MENIEEINDRELLDELEARTLRFLQNGERHKIGIAPHEAVCIHIINRIKTKSRAKESDLQIILRFMRLVKEIDFEDFDMSHQSRRVTRLSGELAKTREHLLVRMRGNDVEALAACQK